MIFDSDLGVDLVELFLGTLTELGIVAVAYYIQG
jgi:hypothetical protein